MLTHDNSVTLDNVLFVAKFAQAPKFLAKAAFIIIESLQDHRFSGVVKSTIQLVARICWREFRLPFTALEVVFSERLHGKGFTRTQFIKGVRKHGRYTERRSGIYEKTMSYCNQE